MGILRNKLQSLKIVLLPESEYKHNGKLFHFWFRNVIFLGRTGSYLLTLRHGLPFITRVSIGPRIACRIGSNRDMELTPGYQHYCVLLSTGTLLLFSIAHQAASRDNTYKVMQASGSYLEPNGSHRKPSPYGKPPV